MGHSVQLLVRDDYNARFAFEKAVSMSRVKRRRNNVRHVMISVPLIGQEGWQVDYSKLNAEAERRFYQWTTDSTTGQADTSAVEAIPFHANAKGQG